MKNTALSTTGLTILRVVVGFLFAAHGWQKYNEWTIAGTQVAFGKMGIPFADVVAPTIATLELGGGIALIFGLFARPVAALLTLNMLGALLLVHLSAGVFVANGGYELVLLLGAAALAIAFAGPGRASVDRALFGSRRSKVSALA